MDYNKCVELRVLNRFIDKVKPKPARPDHSWFKHRGRGGKKGPSPCSVPRNCY